MAKWPYAVNSPPMRTYPDRPRADRRTREVSRRTRAEPLSRERIVAAALEQVEAEGLAQLSTRKVGQRLGCEAMSIYHHFPSKQHLLDALVEHALAQMQAPPDGLTPVERMRHTMHAYRALANVRPALFSLVALHRLNMPAGVRFIEEVLARVQAVVGDPARAARWFRVVGYYLMGAGLDETAGYARGPSAAEPVDDAYIAQHCPRLAGSARFFRRDEWDATFALGVEVLLDAMQRDAVAEASLPAAGRRAERGS